MRLRAFVLGPGLLLLGACSTAVQPGADGGVPLPPTVERPDLPVDGLDTDTLRAFARGNELFGHRFTEEEGLGPVFSREVCSACHFLGARGPTVVERMAVVGPDGITPAVAPGALPFGDAVRQHLAAGATTPILPPDGGLPAGTALRVTPRLAPAVLARGYLEAIDEAEILGVEAAQAARTDGIHGRVNRVRYRSQPNPDTRFHGHQPGETGLVGRFGLKARSATIDDFVADALQADMSLTSTLRPAELPDPDGLTDDLLPGADLGAAAVNDLSAYVRSLRIPPRAASDGRGETVFASTGCSVCHVPALRTRADYPLAPLAGVDAEIYSDLLLHDLGDGLADGVVEERAGPRDWRTAPLLGVRFATQFLHDGRAGTLDEAIRRHASPGSEANGVIERYLEFTSADRVALVAFLATL